jgi:hypothetical protein
MKCYDLRFLQEVCLLPYPIVAPIYLSVFHPNFKLNSCVRQLPDLCPEVHPKHSPAGAFLSRYSSELFGNSSRLAI